jgi:hypothetical protein
MKRLIVLALAIMAVVAPLAGAIGVASAGYSDNQGAEQAP